MPSTALKEHEYEITELIIADKWHERQLMVNMKSIKKKSRGDPKNYKSVHIKFTPGNSGETTTKNMFMSIYMGESQHSSMKRKAMSQMITAFWRSPSENKEVRSNCKPYISKNHFISSLTQRL